MFARAMAAFGHEEPEARRVAIIGGGNIGLVLAEQIEASHPGLSVRIIEGNRDRAEQIARQLARTTVLYGDGLDPELLEEANISSTEVVVAVTNDDEANILASLLAKRYGAQRAITLINKDHLQSLDVGAGDRCRRQPAGDHRLDDPAARPPRPDRRPFIFPARRLRKEVIGGAEALETLGP